MTYWTRSNVRRALALLNKGIRRFVVADNTAFTEDPSFKKLVELYFGEGTKFTLLKEWVEYYNEEPISSILYIHVKYADPPDSVTPYSPTAINQEKLMAFCELMKEMKDYPINMIIDTIYESQEEFLARQTSMARPSERVEHEDKTSWKQISNQTRKDA